jgi:hypothetical protein
MTMAVVTKGPSSFSSSSRQAAWSFVGAIGCCDDGAGIDDEHLVASEPFGQHLVGLARAASGGRLAYDSEAQTAVRRSRRR